MKQREQCTAELKFWLQPTLRDKVEAAAAAEGRSLGSMTRRILERWAAEHDGQSEAAA